MLDIKFVRENPEVVKENIRKKFQDAKLPLVDEVLELDKENRAIKQEVEALRAERNKLSKQIGGLMAKGEKEEAEKVYLSVINSVDSPKGVIINISSQSVQFIMYNRKQITNIEELDFGDFTLAQMFDKAELSSAEKNKQM